jgi:hypothetical protein
VLAGEIDHANRPSSAARETNRKLSRDKHLRAPSQQTPRQCSLSGQARTVTFCTEIKWTPMLLNEPQEPVFVGGAVLVLAGVALDRA